MFIQKVDVQAFTPAFIDGPFHYSHTVQPHLYSRVLRIVTQCGKVGYGESVRAVQLNPGVIDALEDPILDDLPGRPLSDLPVISRTLRDQDLDDVRLRGLAFGLETAYLDLIGRATNQPLSALLGGRLSADVPNYYGIACLTPTESLRQIRDNALGYPIIQVKRGTATFEEDVETVTSVLDLLGEDQILLTDFNGALALDDALRIMEAVKDPRLVWEEPCLTVDDNIAAMHQSGTPVLFDQCLSTFPKTTKAIDAGAYGVCVKPALLGGLTIARAVRDACIDAQVRMRIDGPWCGHIGTATCLHLAVTAPRHLVLAGCELRQPLLLNDDWGGTKHLPDARLAPDPKPGHGAAPPSWPFHN